eukprot:scaffold46325_cov78-Phaeocystis_antarctica.AAC.1
MNELEHHGPELQRMCTPKRLERDAATGKISLTVERDGLEEVCGLLPARPPAARPCFRPHTHTYLPPRLRPSTASTQCSLPSVASQSLTRCSSTRRGSRWTPRAWSRWMPSRTPLPPP